MRFGKICDIDIGDTDTWRNKVFLTFDTDWCSDDVLSVTLDILEDIRIMESASVTL